MCIRDSPLPNRMNIVVSTTTKYQGDNLVSVKSLEDALLLAKGCLLYTSLKNGIRKYGQQYDWDIEIDEYESGEEYFSKNSEGTTIPVSYTHLDVYKRQSNIRIMNPCSCFYPSLSIE